MGVGLVRGCVIMSIDGMEEMVDGGHEAADIVDRVALLDEFLQVVLYCTLSVVAYVQSWPYPTYRKSTGVYSSTDAIQVRWRQFEFGRPVCLDYSHHAYDHNHT